ncbi:Unknown protein [Striga hermonthica]|uniref:RNase H type-1 domain-containing protein n=1 Tax=Striga hermonthica TaxID=68872 RepID=A0A9N7MLR6_STRHE|nr:Unknown protein [Striga hermonthica]
MGRLSDVATSLVPPEDIELPVAAFSSDNHGWAWHYFAHLLPHLSSSASCHKCPLLEETLLYVLRDCPAASQVWLRLVPVAAQPRLFCLHFRTWLTSNLFSRPYVLVDDDSWECTFGVNLWKIWVWRNSLVFQSSEVDAFGKVRDIRAFVHSIVHFAEGARRVGSTGPTRVQRLDIAGVLYGLSWGYVRSLVEIGSGVVGALSGSCLTWDMSFRHLEAEVLDNASVVGFYESLGDASGVHTGLILGINDLLGHSWTIKVKHVFRKTNFATDHMASFVADGLVGYHVFHDPPDGVRQWLRHDLIGVSYSRNVCDLNS